MAPQVGANTLKTHITPYTEIVYGANSLAITLPSVFKILRWVLYAQTSFRCCEWFDSLNFAFMAPC